MPAFFERNKRRIFIIGFFFFIYSSVLGFDIFLKTYLQGAHPTGDVAEVTLGHFSQPMENIILHPKDLGRFLEKVVKGKEGVLAWKPFYLIGMALYCGAAIFIFQKLSGECRKFLKKND